LDEYLEPLRGNLPEIVWDRLKAVAADQASSGEQLVIEKCISHVERAVRGIAGRPDALPPAVVIFYAEELQARIASLIEATPH
jgi:hypothetical protein